MQGPSVGRPLQLVDVVAEQPDATPADLAEHVRQSDPLLSTKAVAGLVGDALAWTTGNGPIDSLAADPYITEIMINGPGPVWVERDGKVLSTTQKLDRGDIFLLIERILDPLGLRVDRSLPFADARLPDGARVNVVVAPLALDGPIVTIRRFPPNPISLEKFGPARLIRILKAAVADQKTILIVGGTGTGKTTLLGALGAQFDPDERVITLEDTAELNLVGRHIVGMEARPANSEGVGEITLQTLVRNSLRMRPDRLVVGEVRGPEALDLILALSAGHAGSMATCHAADPLGGLRRLETLAMLGTADIAQTAIRAQLVDAIDLVVLTERVGLKRAVTSVHEVSKCYDELRTTSVWGRT